MNKIVIPADQVEFSSHKSLDLAVSNDVVDIENNHVLVKKKENPSKDIASPSLAPNNNKQTTMRKVWLFSLLWILLFSIGSVCVQNS